MGYWAGRRVVLGCTLAAASLFPILNTEETAYEKMLKSTSSYARTLDAWAARVPHDAAMHRLVAIRWRAKHQQGDLDHLLEQRCGSEWRTYEYPRVGY